MKEVEFLPCLECGGSGPLLFKVSPYILVFSNVFKLSFENCLSFEVENPKRPSTVSLLIVEITRFLNFLDTNNFWMGRGGSKSVVPTLDLGVLR